MRKRTARHKSQTWRTCQSILSAETGLVGGLHGGLLGILVHLVPIYCLVSLRKFTAVETYRSGSGVKEEHNVLGGHNSCRHHTDRVLFLYFDHIYT